VGTLALWDPKAITSAASTASPANADAAGAAVASASSVTSAARVPDPTYSSLLQPKLKQVVWAAPPNDSISSLMKANLRSSGGDSSSLLKGLGSALLDRFTKTQDDFRQSAVGFSPVTADPSQTSNNVNLKIHLVSGKEVDVSIAFGDDDSTPNSLSVDVHTSGKLTAAEQAAVASLSAGFEAALQGVSQNVGKIDLGGLEKFDPSKVASVDFSYRGSSPPVNEPATAKWSPIQSLNFHADATHRSLDVKGVAGNVSVNVDMSQPEFIGTAAQQQKAIQSYLSQFDTANNRAHGSSMLVGEFKDAFAQLNSSYPAAGSIASHTPNAPDLSAQDVAALSGLADFKASMSGDFSNDTDKVRGHLDYQVSQTTQWQELVKGNLSVGETQNANLDAEYAKYRDPASLAKGNYEIFRVTESTSTTIAFEYAKDKLKSAFITTTVNQMDEYEKLVGSKVVEKKDTPTHQSNTQDISAQWQPTAA
jgi:hypothetical protein